MGKYVGTVDSVKREYTSVALQQSAQELHSAVTRVSEYVCV